MKRTAFPPGSPCGIIARIVPNTGLVAQAQVQGAVAAGRHAADGPVGPVRMVR